MLEADQSGATVAAAAAAPPASPASGKLPDSAVPTDSETPNSTGPASPADLGETGSRPKAQWLARLAWSAGMLTVGIGLYVCYLHVSRTQHVSSDGASNALQAWAMLHGNPLLRGWKLTDVSFYTTELPEYVIVEAIRGLHADVLHVSAAITYTLLVLVAGLLARGRATGREGVTRMLIAAGIMIAPQLGPGVFILVFQPDHIGTQVPLLATWLVLDRAPRRGYVPVVVGAMLAWIGVADRLMVVIGVLPLLAVCIMRAYQGVVQRREPVASRWFDLSLAAAAVMSVGVSSVVVKLIGEHGGFAVHPVGTALATADTVPAHAWLTVQGVLGQYGAGFFGMTLGPTAGIAFLHLAGVALAVWALCRVLRRFFSCDDLIAQVLALGILLNLAAYALSTMPTTYWSTREIALVLPGGAVLAGRMLAGSVLKARLVPALAVVLACYLAALGYTASRPPVPAVSQDLADWLAAHHFSYGLSSYGLANATTLASGGTVGLRPVTWDGSGVSAGPWNFDQAWYNPLAHDADYFVLLKTPAALDPIAAWEVRVWFGPSEHIYYFGQYIIMTWDTNLLYDLRPTPPV